METDLRGRELRPELLSRRGEWTSWGMAVVFFVLWLFLRANGREPWVVLPVFAALLGVVSFTISLSNWVDRSTWLRLDESGIAFSNGLRRVRLAWDDIRQVRISPATWSRRVQVIGAGGFFTFHTLGEVRYQGEVRGRVGFAQGDAVLREIVQMCKMKFVAEKQPGYAYYTRE